MMNRNKVKFNLIKKKSLLFSEEGNPEPLSIEPPAAAPKCPRIKYIFGMGMLFCSHCTHRPVKTPSSPVEFMLLPDLDPRAKELLEHAADQDLEEEDEKKMAISPAGVGTATSADSKEKAAENVHEPPAAAQQPEPAIPGELETFPQLPPVPASVVQGSNEGREIENSVLLRSVDQS